ncbi:MAG: MlaD family protein, partial [Pseudomonadota bacterium]
GFDGVRLHFNSVNSLLVGGVAFGNIGRTVGTGAASIEKPYLLYRNRNSAIEAGFEIQEGRGYLLMAEFDESIRGLEAGAPIEWQGILVGRVKDVVFDLGPPGSNERRIYAVLEMQPSRVGLDNLGDEALQESMTAWVASGMRAQLAAGNVLSGRKLIKLIDDAAPADDARRIDFSAKPYPRLPTIPAPNLDAVSSNVQKIVADVAQLPIDQLVGSLIQLVDGAGAFVTDPALGDIPDELRAALVSLNMVAANLSDASQDLPQLIDNIITVVAVAERTLSGLSPDSEVYVELSAALSELKDATHAVAELLQTLEDKPNALILGK